MKTNFSSMRCLIRPACLLVAPVLLAAMAMAQGEGAPPPPPPGNMAYGPMGMMHADVGDGKTVTGAPMSAQEIVVRDNTLADGNRIHSQTTTNLYRDSAGRVRREVEVELMTPSTGALKRTMVIITDPVAGKRYMLTAENKTARETPLRAHDHGPKGPGGAHAEPDMGGPMMFGAHIDSASIKEEQLGTKTMLGLQVQGIKVTRIIAAGEIGNDKPIEVVTERWYSSDLQLPLMTTHTDPMIGTITTKLVNINRAEPDAALFQVPSDYKLVQGGRGEPFLLPGKP